MNIRRKKNKLKNLNFSKSTNTLNTMRIVRHIVLLLIVSVSVLLMGMPAYACHEMHDDTQHTHVFKAATTGKSAIAAYQSHETGDNHLAQHSKICLCCGSCSAALLDNSFSLPEFNGHTVRAYITEQTLFSSTPQTQDRPPKLLS